MSAPPRPRVEDGPAAGRRFAAGRRAIAAGRQDGNTAVPDDPSRSRRHSRLEWREGRLVATAPGSASGARRNGHPIAGPQRPQPGDRPQFGATAPTAEGGSPTATAGAGRRVAGRPVTVSRRDDTAPHPAERPLPGPRSPARSRRPRRRPHPDDEIVPHDIQATRRHTRPGPREGRVLMADPGAKTGTRLADQPASAPAIGAPQRRRPAMRTTVAEAARSPAAGRTGRTGSGGPTKV